MTELRKGKVPLLGAASRRARAIVCSIVPDPYDKMKMHVAISAGGVFYTEDGSRSWLSRNRDTRADFLPDRHPGFVQCVHNLLPEADGKRFCQLDRCGAIGAILPAAAAIYRA